MENMNILAFFLSYPSLPIDASDESSEEAIKRGDEFRTYIWGEKGIDILLKSLSYIDYGKDLKRILFQFYIMPCGYERIHIKEIEQYRKKENSVIEIYANQGKENVILYIKDNGIGIKQGEITRVFEKGFTGTNGRLSNKKSTGIGLYLCKMKVQKSS